MKDVILHRLCVYTIVRGDKLDSVFHEDNRAGCVNEKTNWTTPQKALASALEKGETLIVVFADARHTENLIYWAVLKDIQIGKNVDGKINTTFFFTDLTPFQKPLPKKRDLVRYLKEAKLSDDFIKPYALCKSSSIQNKLKT